MSGAQNEGARRRPAVDGGRACSGAHASGLALPIIELAEAVYKYITYAERLGDLGSVIKKLQRLGTLVPLSRKLRLRAAASPAVPIRYEEDDEDAFHCSPAWVDDGREC